MTRRGYNIENRGTSIRLEFVLEKGKPPVRRTLTSNGRPLPPTPANLRYAERIAAEIREKIRLGSFRMGDYFEDEAGPTMRLALWLDHWMGTQRLEESTKGGYKSASNFWKAAPVDRPGMRPVKLGDLTLSEVVHSDILSALASRPELSGKTVNNYVSVLREAFELAVLDKVLPANPAAKVPRAKWQKPPPDPFSLEEARAIADHIARKWPGHVGNYVAFAFFTGMRTSELAGLRWGSIDFRHKTVLVHEAVVRGKRKDNTKTDVTRYVHLNSEAMAALQAQKALTFLAGEAVFHDPRTGAGWADERSFRRSYWSPTLKALGIRYRRPYNMRHTYATVLLMAGAKPLWVATQMGHSLDVLLDRYAKWIPGGHDAAELAQVERFIGGPTATTSKETTA